MEVTLNVLAEPLPVPPCPKAIGLHPQGRPLLPSVHHHGSNLTPPGCWSPKSLRCQARWVENPYWQYFCGAEFFQHQFPGVEVLRYENVR